MSKFGRSPEGKAYEVDLHESAQRLHKLVGAIDPVIFEAYLTLGRTWETVRRMGDKYVANMGLTPYQRHSIRFLLMAPNQRLTIGELAVQLETTSVNTTKLVNRMQRSGMVRREVDGTDRRVTWVVLTDLGREKYIAALPISSSDIEVFGALTPAEQVTLIDLLIKIREKAEEFGGYYPANTRRRPSERTLRPSSVS